jgi:hypothetical protein
VRVALDITDRLATDPKDVLPCRLNVAPSNPKGIVAVQEAGDVALALFPLIAGPILAAVALWIVRG